MRVSTHAHKLTHTYIHVEVDYTQLVVRPNVCSKLLRSSTKHCELCRLLLAPATEATDKRSVFVCECVFVLLLLLTVYLLLLLLLLLLLSLLFFFTCKPNGALLLSRPVHALLHRAVPWH